MKYLLFSLLTASLLCTTACKTGASKTGENKKNALQMSLENKKWILIKFAESDIDCSKLETPYALWNSENQRLEANVGCNRIGAGYTLEKQALSHQDIFSTKKFCNELMPAENALKKALEQTARFSIDDKLLMLYDKADKELARFQGE